jgi:hypothetical protein
MLSSLLFIASTADIKDNLTSPFALSVDDIKVYTHVCNSCNNLVLLVQNLQVICK